MRSFLNKINIGEPGKTRPLMCFSLGFFVTCLLGCIFFQKAVGIIVSIVIAAIFLVLGRIGSNLRNAPFFYGLIVAALWFTLFTALFYNPAARQSDTTGELMFAADGYAVGYGSYGVCQGRLITQEGKSYGAVVYTLSGYPDWTPGQVYTFSGSVTLSDLHLNDLARGRFLEVTQHGYEDLAYRSPTIANRAAIFSNSVKERIAAILPGEEGALLTAVLTGDNSGIGLRLRRMMTQSGAAHITAVSGMHISLLTGFFILAFGRKAGLIIGIPAAFIYAALAGFSPSVMRAVIMFFIMALAFFLQKERDVPTAVFTALLALLLFNPYSAVSAGLLLSFGGTLGILLFSNKIIDGLNVTNKLLRTVTAGVATSVGANVICLPLSMIFFQNISFMSAVTTLLAYIPVAAGIILGFVMLLVSLISLPAAAFVGKWIVIWPLKLIITIFNTFGNIPWQVLSASSPYALFFIIASAVIILLSVTMQRIKIPVALGLCGVLLGLTLSLTAIERGAASTVIVTNNRGRSTMAVCDSGSAALINTGSGKTAYELTGMLAGEGVEKIESLILTKNDYGYYSSVLSAYNDTVVYASDSFGEHMQYSAGGSIQFQGMRIELIAIEDAYAAKVTGAVGYGILDMTGIQSLFALQRESYDILKCDVLLIDGKTADHIDLLRQLVRGTEPKLIIYAENKYSDSFDEDSIMGVPVINLCQEESLYIKIPRR